MPRAFPWKSSGTSRRYSSRCLLFSREDLTRLMLRTDELAADVGSILYGEEAVQLGLIDQLGDLTDALDWLYQTMGKKKTT